MIVAALSADVKSCGYACWCLYWTVIFAQHTDLPLPFCRHSNSSSAHHRPPWTRQVNPAPSPCSRTICASDATTAAQPAQDQVPPTPPRPPVQWPLLVQCLLPSRGRRRHHHHLLLKPPLPTVLRTPKPCRATHPVRH
jgi:hypothetical protein